MIVVGLTTITLVAATPSNATDAPSRKPVPVIVTGVAPAGGPSVGLIAATVGAGLVSAGIGIFHMPRPWVATKSVVIAVSVKTIIAVVVGKPFIRVLHEPPLSVERKTPTSVPMTKIGGLRSEEGELVMLSTGTSGRLVEIFVQLSPPVVVFQTCPTPKFPKVV